MGTKESGTTKNTYALELHDVGFSYDVKDGKYEVFRKVSIQIHRNEIFCIIGPSGCGKTTLINIIAGFETPSAGKAYEEGKEISGVSHKRALVFQQDAVFPWLTVYNNIEYGPKIRGIPPEARKRTVERLIGVVGLTGFEKAYSRELSGGMRKRVDLARALASDPKILLMDEPFGSVDAITKEKLQVEVTEIWEKSNMTVVFITHDLEEALFLGDRIAVMQHISVNIPFKIFSVPFGRPRNIFLKEDPDFQNMRRKLIEEFKLI